MATVAMIIFILVLLSDYLAKYIPFSWETQLSTPIADRNQQDALQEREPIESYLQSLADKMIAVQSLPDGMTITVHYLDDSSVNAFATLGGHVFFFRGLLEKMPSENALAMSWHMKSPMLNIATRFRD